MTKQDIQTKIDAHWAEISTLREQLNALPEQQADLAPYLPAARRLRYYIGRVPIEWESPEVHNNGHDPLLHVYAKSIREKLFDMTPEACESLFIWAVENQAKICKLSRFFDEHTND